MSARSISMKLRHRPSKTKQASIRQLLTENRCRTCAVVITRMDFAKILGKHSKVKIQYDSPPPAVTQTRLKRNENGMVDLPRSAYSKHPVKDIFSPKMKLNDNVFNKSSVTLKKQPRSSPKSILHPQQKSPKKKKTVVTKECLNVVKSNEAYYLSFKNNRRPTTKSKDKNKKLLDLLPHINKSILPSPNWTMNYLPDIGEPLNDKVYDKIAAELEDLMNSDVNKVKRTHAADVHSDELPSIMDILNDNNKDSISTESKSELASSDIEAMLMGTPSPSQQQQSEASQDSATMSSDGRASQHTALLTDIDEPASPSIFDDAIHKDEDESECKHKLSNGILGGNEDMKENLKSVTHLIFKEFKNDVCLKTVTFLRNLNYKVEIGGKIVELIAAPKCVESPKDIRSLLQIVDFTDLAADYLEVL